MGVLDLLFPPLCLGCRSKLRVRLGLCPDCLDQVEHTGLKACIRCGRICHGKDCAPIRHRYSRVLSLALYQGPWRKVVQGVKFARDKSVALELAGELSRLALEAGFALPAAVVPVPSASKHWRNYDAVDLICQKLSQSTGAPIWNILARQPGRLPQVRLNRRQRLEGLEDYIYLADKAKDLQGALLWLVDDVYTTGSTADACAAALLGAGAKSVYFFVLAA